MKKWIFLILALVASYLALTYYAGIETEKNIRQQLALHNSQTSSGQPQIRLQDYHRGFFNSELQATVELSQEGQSLGGRVVTDIVLWHGPFIFADGFKAGWFYATGAPDVQWSDSEHQRFFDQVFSEGLGLLNLWGRFSGAYQLQWNIPAIDFSDPEFSLQMEPTSIHTKGLFNALNSEHVVSLGAFQMMWGNSRVSASSTTVDASVSFVADDIPLSDVSLSLEHIEFGGFFKGQLQGVALQQTQELVNGNVDTHVQLTLERAESLVSAEQLSFDLSILQTSFTTIRAWADWSLAAKQSSGAADFNEEELQEKMLAALRSMFHPDAAVDLAMAMRLPRGEVKAQANLAAKDVQPARVKQMDYADLVNSLEGNGELRVAEEVLIRSPMFFLLAEFIATYMSLEPPDYVMRAALSNGELIVNGRPVPLQNLLPDAYR